MACHEPLEPFRKTGFDSSIGHSRAAKTMGEHIRHLGFDGLTRTLAKCLMLVFSILAIGSAQSTQDIKIIAVTNSADFQPGLSDRGSLASIFCTGLKTVDGIQSATQYPLPYDIAGVSVH